MTAALQIENVRHRYGERQALAGLSLAIEPGQIFAILGPNGSGKSTLFKLISTLLPLQEGEIAVCGYGIRQQPNRVRAQLGVVFQHPSLDRKLTVLENLQCGASLVGLSGRQRSERIDEVLAALRIADRAGDRVEKLSGGLKRRVELAKSVLHRPAVLLLDEPSTGLDPSARLDLWQILSDLRSSEGTTAVLTTHLLEEADKADRIAILNEGSLVANGPPQSLRRDMGEAVLTIDTAAPEQVQGLLQSRFGWPSDRVGGKVLVRQADAAGQLTEVHAALGVSADAVTLARPSLEDVFIARTGRSWSEVDVAPPPTTKRRKR